MIIFQFNNSKQAWYSRQALIGGQTTINQRLAAEDVRYIWRMNKRAGFVCAMRYW